ncbi:MAG: asparagine synthase (glutamine-hydrolyzing) [Arcobacter sp.]|uniref:asparagine synthase (glutamine-hydrolyzing) n=1 Tax=Arcobacter sp. TaxID=1872629 RepID=UPI003AFFD77A
MCSVFGSYNPRFDIKEFERYNNRLKHRGPDNSSVKEYTLKNKVLFFGHNRLAIQDLSTSAVQPMENDKYVIVFNGEIYNHNEIRAELKFNSFISSSDTETILYSFMELGIEKTLEKLIGMFAIALFDKLEQKVYLIRDRVGIKPLYYSNSGDEFVFASELKAFPNHLKEKVSKKAKIQFMTLGYIPKNNTYYEGINKLEAGYYLTFDGVSTTTKKYWDIPSSVQNIEYNEALVKTEELLHSSIKYRLLSDVEVGSFLSGGIDSSLVTSIMQKESSNRIKTFSIGFEDKKYDESMYAKQIAEYLETDHYEYKFKANDVLALVDQYDNHYDEPFGDASSLPMMLLSKITKDEVTVSLSGDGGDELFLGYDRYFMVNKYFNKLKVLPKPLRSVMSILMKYSCSDKLQKLSFPLNNLSEENLYSILYSAIKPWEVNSVFDQDYINEAFGKSSLTLYDILEYNDDNTNLFDKFSRLDFHRYLKDDILTKVDRASMAYSLEARVPLLDHRLVEHAYSLPPELKLRNGPKSILKDILYKHIPKELVERPKKGFGVPLQTWFRKELKDIVFEKINILDDSVNKNFLIKVFNEHQKGKNFEYILWNIMRLK